MQQRNIHVMDGVATSISTDGTTAMLVFMAADGGEVSFSLPTASLGALRTMCIDLVRQARNFEVGPGHVAPRYPAAYSIGHSSQMRGTVALMFDPETPDEAVYILKDDAALNFAEAIRQDVISRAPPADRRSLMASASRIILPR